MKTEGASTTIDRSTDQSDGRTKPILNRERVNLESHQLVWCDDSYTDDQKLIPPLQELRKIVDYAHVFGNASDCQSYLMTQSPVDTVTFLVCSTGTARTLVPEIHELNSIRFIYLYSSPHDQQWTSAYKKVKDVGNSSPLSVLGVDVQHHLLYESVGLLTEDFRLGEGGESEDRSTEHFLSWWPAFIRVLCHLPYPREQCQRRLVSELKDYYREKDAELRRIDDFERNYSIENAVWWYTRDSFIFRILNKALRRHNIRVMALFGYFLKDLYVQLKKEHNELRIGEQPVLKVFRSQIMSNAELDTVYGGYQEILKRRRYKQDRDAEQFGFDPRSDHDFEDLDWCKEIYFNSFCSTTLNRNVALIFLESATSVPHGFSPVLLEIDLDSRFQSRPFGNVSHLSNFPEESEILLMIGMRLLIQRVTFDEGNGVYTVKLELNDDRDTPKSNTNEYEVERQPNTTQRSTLSKCVSMVATQFDMAFCSPDIIDAIFSELEELFPEEREWLQAAARHQCLAVCNQKKWVDGKNTARALWHYRQAITGWHRYADDVELNCVGTLEEINRGMVSLYAEYAVNNNMAVEPAISILDSLPTRSENNILTTYQTIAVVHLNLLRICTDLDIDFKNEAHNESRREQLEETLELNGKDWKTGESLLKLAELQECEGYVDRARLNYSKAEEIFRELTLSNDDPMEM